MAGLSAYDIKHMNDGRGKTYTVKAGDNLAKIAKNIYGNERMMAEIIRLNGGGLRTIQPGMILRLPKPKANEDIFISNDWAKNMGMATTDQLKEYYAVKPDGRATTDFNAAGFGWKNSVARGGAGIAGLSPLAGTGGTTGGTAMTPAQIAASRSAAGRGTNRNSASTMPIPSSYQQHPTPIPALPGPNQGPKIPDTPVLLPPQMQRLGAANFLKGLQRPPSYGGTYNPTGQQLGGNPFYTGNPAYGGTYNPSGQQLGGNPLYTGQPAYGGRYNPSGVNTTLADVNATLTGQKPEQVGAKLPGSANLVTPKGGATQGLPAPTPDLIIKEQTDKAATKMGRIINGSGETFTKADADLLVMDLGLTPGSPDYAAIYGLVANPGGAPKPGGAGGMGGVTPSPDNGFWDSNNVGYYGSMPYQARSGGRGGGGGGGGNFADWSQNNGYGPFLGLTNWRGI